MLNFVDKFLGSKVGVVVDQDVSMVPEPGFVIAVDPKKELMLVAMSREESPCLMEQMRFADLALGTELLANTSHLEGQLEKASDELAMFGEGSIELESFKSDNMIFVWVDEDMVEIERSHVELLVDTLLKLLGGVEDNEI